MTDASATYQCLDCNQYFQKVLSIQVFDGTTGAEIRLGDTQMQTLALKSGQTRNYHAVEPMRTQVYTDVGDEENVYSTGSEEMEDKIRAVLHRRNVPEQLVGDFLAWVNGRPPVDEGLFNKLAGMQTTKEETFIKNRFCNGKASNHVGFETVAGDSDDDDENVHDGPKRKAGELCTDVVVVGTKRVDIGSGIIHPLSPLLQQCITHPMKKMVVVYNSGDIMHIYTRGEIMQILGIPVNTPAPWERATQKVLDIPSESSRLRAIPTVPSARDEYNRLVLSIGDVSLDKMVESLTKSMLTSSPYAVNNRNYIKFICSEYSANGLNAESSKFGKQFEIFFGTRYGGNHVYNIVRSIYANQRAMDKETMEIFLDTFYNPESWYIKRYGPRAKPSTSINQYPEYLFELYANVDIVGPEVVDNVFMHLFDPAHRVVSAEYLVDQLISTFKPRSELYSGSIFSILRSERLRQKSLEYIIRALFDPNNDVFTSEQKKRILNASEDKDCITVLYYTMQNLTTKAIWTKITRY